MTEPITKDQLTDAAIDVQQKMGDIMIGIIRAQGMSTAMSVMILSCTEMLSKTIGAIADKELRERTVEEISNALKEGSEKAALVFSGMHEVHDIMRKAAGTDDAA